MSPRPILLLHGGAGRWRAPRERIERALKDISDALEHGYRFLRTGSAVDAVVEAVAYMEDSGSFNAGVGSVLNLIGVREMDAGVMDGSRLKAGAVASVTYPRNPVRLARIVMEKTDHVMLAGSGADLVAKKLGLEAMPQPGKELVERFNELKKRFIEGSLWYYRCNPSFATELSLLDTVGAVALDNDGRLASATSTGGIWLKLPGRVGDSPIPGAGFWADDLVAASATGLGEVIMLSMPGIRLSVLAHQGYSIIKSGELVLDYITRKFGRDTIGFIAIDRYGEHYVGFNTEHMMVAFKSPGKSFAKLLSRVG